MATMNNLIILFIRFSCFSPDQSPQLQQTQRNQYLSCIIERDIHIAQFLLKLSTESVQYQDNVADQKEHRPNGKDAGKCTWICDQVADGEAIEQHDRADVHDAKYLKCHLRRDLFEDPDHQKDGQYHAENDADDRFFRQRRDCGKIEDMPGQKYQDTDQKDQLPFRRKHHSEVQQDISNKPEDKPEDDQSRRMSAGAARDPQNDKAERCQTLQNNCGYILFFAFCIKKQSGQKSTNDNQNVPHNESLLIIDPTLPVLHLAQMPSRIPAEIPSRAEPVFLPDRTLSIPNLSCCNLSAEVFPR